ncbi:MAG: hypothetical protein Q4E10_04040 [Porphyromonas sp.]|nr:hypothetical protein [Porphyromonas sp.]
MKKSTLLLLTVSMTIAAFSLTGCLNNTEYPPIQFERKVLGTATVNDQPYEHAVYIADRGVQRNPYLFAAPKDHLIYFPIVLTPKGGTLETAAEYAILLYMDVKEGIPELNKAYHFKYSDTAEELAEEERQPGKEYLLLTHFIKKREHLLPEGGNGLAIVYNYVQKDKIRSAEGTVTFTSFDTEKKICTGTYQLRTTVGADDHKDAKPIEITDGKIETKYYTPKPSSEETSDN